MAKSHKTTVTRRGSALSQSGKSTRKSASESKTRSFGVSDSAKQATHRFITKYRPALRDLEKH